ncbi:putative small GTPase, P-loop containing nucleoside triphosphate hydrolase [Helianthus annuus]|nr:putative small GTPase, P-loop containing nucleoside triphosphate hydrolase [Helianthus annuus]
MLWFLFEKKKKKKKKKICVGKSCLLLRFSDGSFTTNIRNWIRNIEQHASDNVNKILVGNKADMDESKRAVPTAKGQALADEYGIKFFETKTKKKKKKKEGIFVN